MRNGKNHHTKRSNERIIMAQYQVDSEQIQSSSAAVNAPSKRFVNRCKACTPISTICKAFGAAEPPRNSMRWRNNGGQPSSRWSSRLNRFNMRFRKRPCSIRKPKCRRRVCSRSSGRCFRYGQSSSKHKEKRSPPPPWEAGSADSFSLMPLALPNLWISSPCQRQRPERLPAVPACWPQQPRWSGTDQRWKLRSAERNG